MLSCSFGQLQPAQLDDAGADRSAAVLAGADRQHVESSKLKKVALSHRFHCHCMQEEFVVTLEDRWAS